ncbi:T9SS type A sorting domain-containing protein [Rhodohalobacter barkolensis]|uniref:LTD domain-containing protein n=1 Tax=Rhodohalobacter barkolensis TaxID=2053187 RepID=A0A2N0VJM0_9BACT|nr:T9SS type A sorting domain-containing protein [Rhodohalobacter barkolensis]PKD44381.1 hypothetical protein CWD77_02620 [Rhodohalobacter barkolensis]
MGKPLQKGIFTVLFYLLAFTFLITARSQAQVVIQDERGLEIAFSASGSLNQSQIIQLTPSDISSLFFEGEEITIRPWGESSDSASPFFVESESGDYAIGGLKPANSPKNRLFYLSLANTTSSMIDGINVAFDLLYLPTDNSDFSLQLRYKLGDQEWTDVPGATLNSSMLRGDKEGWNSFSVQSTLDQILLEQEEAIEFEWIDRNGEMDADQIPVAIQHVELFPEIFTPSEMKRGDLIITEILPTTELSNGNVEFVELYNPTEKTISLKGVEVRTSNGSSMIRTDFELSPNSFGVITSASSPEFIRSNQVYRYSNSILSDNNGFVELYSGDREVAKATFERMDTDRSLELNRISNAFDGYTSLQYLSPSATTLSGNVSASPGNAGSAQKLFVKELTGNGWYFISSPGLLDERLSRINFQNINMVRSEVGSFSDFEPNEPLFIYQEDGTSRKLYSVESTQNLSDKSYPINDTSSKIVTAQDDLQNTIGKLTDDSGRRVSPVYLYWNNTDQKFQLLYDENSKVSRWDPLIVNRSVNDPGVFSAETRSIQGNRMDRFIHFSFLELTQDGSRKRLDHSIVGFLREERGQTSTRFDLPKLLPISNDEKIRNDLSMMHISSDESADRTNSFVHFPFDLDQTYSFDVGVISSDRTYQAVLDWSDMLDIPDEWILTLKDNLTGSEIDMKEQGSYEFRVTASEGDLKQMEVEPGTITAFNPDEDERFTVTMKPYESSAGITEETERPGSVELRQNYPNPFNPSTNIVFYLPEQQPVKIGVYNIVGQQVALLADEPIGAGEHTISWNASEMPSGVYIVQLEVGSRIFTRKITLIK